MKKYIALLLAAIMILSFCACGGKTANNTEKIAYQDTTANIDNIDAQEGEGKYTAYTYDGDATDLFTIEEVVLMPQRYSNGTIALQWKMKVRNTSGEDLLMKESSMRVWFRYLDENEDELRSGHLTEGYSNTIKDGKAVWLEMMGTPSGWTNADVASIAYIEIYGYTNTLNGYPDYEFENYVTINVRDFFDWNDIK